MKTTAMATALTLAVCTGLAAQQPAPANPPPGAPRAVFPTGERDRDAQRLVEMAAVDARRAAGDPMERFLIPPDLIMRRQREIGLQAAQRTQITQAIQRLEASLVELQWNMQDQQQALGELLQQPQVNTDAALQALDRVLTTEAAVKRIHFQTLIQIRNVLTPDQVNQLRQAREPFREEER